MKQVESTWKTISILAFTQVLSWGSLYYTIAILGPEIQKEMNWRAEIVFGAFSWSLLVAGMISTHVGIMLDRYSGRTVMGIGSLVSGCGLIGIGLIDSTAAYYTMSTVLGIGMALTLYEAAFTTINQHFTVNAREAISTLTLFGGFASTIFWPLTLKLNTLFGWRETYIAYGVAQILICFPLHFFLDKNYTAKKIINLNLIPNKSITLIEAIKHPTFWKLALAFSANSFVFSALSVHLIALLKQFGHNVKFAVMCAALIGPSQVAGRLGEKIFAKVIQSQTVGKLSFSTLPLALLILILFTADNIAVILFCLLYGFSNGVSTILKGTIPRLLFGSENYGAISGAMAGPSLVLKAAGPLVVGMMIEKNNLSSFAIVGTLLFFSSFSLVLYLKAIKYREVKNE